MKVLEETRYLFITSANRNYGDNSRFTVFVPDNLISYSGGQNKSLKVSMYDIKLVSIKTGTNILPYSLAGAGIGALLSIYASSQVNRFPINEDFNKTSYFLGFSIGSAIIGGIFGAINTKWKKLYLDKKYFNPAPGLSLKPSINVQKSFNTFGLMLTF